jgi:hypothetical protein
MQPGVHWSCRRHAKRILPIAPHRKKAARALHRKAFHTTADFAVPPLYLIHNRRKRKWLRSSPIILECNDEIGPSAIEGMAMRERDR